MLVAVNSKPHGIVIYIGVSITRGRPGLRFLVKQGGTTVHKDGRAPESRPPV